MFDKAVLLISDPEDGSDTFLRNVGSYTDQTQLFPHDGNIHNCSCESLQSYKFWNKCVM
jgi:hypothetical protein